MFSLKNRLAELYMHSPLAPWDRWDQHIRVYLPLLENVFEGNHLARLRTLRVMDALKSSSPPETLQRLLRLRAVCSKEQPKEQALFFVLAGLYHNQQGEPGKMAAAMRTAGKHGHTFTLPHEMLCKYNLFQRADFPEAIREADTAIDCIYRLPPLDEHSLRYMATLYASMACAQTMMHHFDEAEALLAKAEKADDTVNYLHAKALLRAAQGNREEAEATLQALQQHDCFEAHHANVNVPLLLDGTHPHFTAKIPDESAIRAYWQWFLQEEKHLLDAILCTDRHAAYHFHHEGFKALAPESGEVDRMLTGFDRTDGRPRILFHTCFSRTVRGAGDQAAGDLSRGAARPLGFHSGRLSKKEEPPCTRSFNASSTKRSALYSSAARG